MILVRCSEVSAVVIVDNSAGRAERLRACGGAQGIGVPRVNVNSCQARSKITMNSGRPSPTLLRAQEITLSYTASLHFPGIAGDSDIAGYSYLRLHNYDLQCSR